MPVKEFRGNFTDIVAIHELRGSYPDIAIPSDIDYSVLTAGEADPMFVTLPIGKANVKSGNGRFYDDAWLAELERQTLANRPIGLMGHLSESERPHAMPSEAVFWLGTARVNDVLWAKGFVPSGPAKERIKRYKASGKSIATSIDAFAEGKWSDALGAFHMDASTLRLNQIDIAPADRAGIPDLAAVPLLTTEMDAPGTETEQEPITMAEKQEVLQELRKVSVPPQRGWTPSNTNEQTELAAIRELLGVDDKADLTKVISEMRQQQEVQRKSAVKARITELAAPTSDKGIKVDSVRGLVTELVAARNPQTVEEADAAYNQVVEMQSVKDALTAAVQSTMGPRQRTPLQQQNGKQNKYFVIPTDGKEEVR